MMKLTDIVFWATSPARDRFCLLGITRRGQAWLSRLAQDGPRERRTQQLELGAEAFLAASTEALRRGLRLIDAGEGEG